jgi:hypothetical protein
MSYRTKVRVRDLHEKYPHFETEFLKMWRNVIKEALAGQVARYANSKSLRGMKNIVKRHWPYFSNEEADKVVDMISSRFNNHKLLPDWDGYRSRLPNIFPEITIGQFAFLENDDGNFSMSMSDISKPSSDDVCIIIIQGAKLNAQFTDVPQDTAYSILSELSKSLA